MTREGLASLQGKQTGLSVSSMGWPMTCLLQTSSKDKGHHGHTIVRSPSHRHLHRLLHLSLGATDSAMEEGTPNRKERVQTHTRSQGQ